MKTSSAAAFPPAPGARVNAFTEAFSEMTALKAAGMDRFNSFSRGQGPKCSVWRRWEHRAAGRGSGLGGTTFGVSSETSVSPPGAPGPVESVRAPYLQSTAWLFTLAARGRDSQEGRMGAIPPQIPPDVRRQVTRRKKLQRQKKGRLPSSPLCHFFCLGCCIGWSRLILSVYLHTSEPPLALQ